MGEADGKTRDEPRGDVAGAVPLEALQEQERLKRGGTGWREDVSHGETAALVGPGVGTAVVRVEETQRHGEDDEQQEVRHQVGVKELQERRGVDEGVEAEVVRAGEVEFEEAALLVTGGERDWGRYRRRRRRRCCCCC